MKKNIITLTFALLVLVLIGSCRKDKVDTACVSNTTIHFATQIKPMLDNNCTSCHGAGGTPPNLTSHANVAANAGVILNSLTGTGVQLMPQGGPALNDTLINQFSCWISQGKQNN